MSTRFYIAFLIFILAGFFLFGVGLLFVLMVPSLSAHAFQTIPVLVVISVVAGSVLSWILVPRITGQ